MATKKPTKDEQIKSLQRQRDDLLETAELQQQQLNKLLAAAEDEYINSTSYVQMREEIQRLQGLREADEMIIKQQRETIERYKAEVVALTNQIEGEGISLDIARRPKNDDLDKEKSKLEEDYAEKEKSLKNENRALKGQVEMLKQEVAALRGQIDQGAGQAAPVHNARGAGRKPDIVKRQLFAQLYTAGADMETIMEQMQIGRRTYYRYLAAYRKDINN